MKKALIVGIDYYADVPSLYGCVSDAKEVKQVLERHADGTINFSIRMLNSTCPRQYVCRNELRATLVDLFSSFGDDGLSLNHNSHHYSTGTEQNSLAQRIQTGSDSIKCW